MIRNSIIFGFEVICPQIDVSTSCFLHSLITREICFRTAQQVSSYRFWTSSFSLSIARVYCVRLLVSNEMKSIPISQMSLIRIAAAGVSIIMPNVTFSIFTSSKIVFACFTSSIEIICGNITPNL